MPLKREANSWPQKTLNRCPIFRVNPNTRGDHQHHPLWDVRETLYFMQHQPAGEKDSPFWTNLPLADIFQSFTPDLLHQLHKEVFKDNLVAWCTEIIGKLEIDKHFREMPDHHGIRHFKNGISSVSQWTGTEHKEMEKAFLGLIAAGAHPQMVAAVRGLMDFAYFASLQSHTSITLAGMRDSLDTFHANKQIFINLKGQRLHIDYAKNAYRASNRKDYIEQMTVWLQRQEAVARFSVYLEWAHPAALTPPPAAAASESQPITKSPVDQDSLVISRRTFSMAKLPATRAVSASHIIAPEGHSASRFITTLTTFLGPSHSRFTPRTFDVFGTWKRISFELPKIPEVGLRVAQVKVIFQIPKHYPVNSGSPVAYIEWMTPFRTPDPLDGYYHLSRSSR
ncbi:hypothetical protein B0H10DRAFT_2172932 [Mycena sp. CBHHK59/15]|nr:hypothetical protein B0H10DRAFT_2172932 [Mycena sp. CBHHK59/15]